MRPDCVPPQYLSPDGFSRRSRRPQSKIQTKLARPRAVQYSTTVVTVVHNSASAIDISHGQCRSQTAGRDVDLEYLSVHYYTVHSRCTSRRAGRKQTLSDFWAIFTHGSSRARERGRGGPSPARVEVWGLGPVISPGKSSLKSFSLTVHCILCMCAGLYKYTRQLRSEEKKIIDTVDTVVN
jgi:hypothetical protein